MLLMEAFVDEEEDTLPRTAVIFDVLVEVDDELILLLVLDDFPAVDEVDDLIYFARAGEDADLTQTLKQLAEREGVSVARILEAASDDGKATCLHMAAANGHGSEYTHPHDLGREKTLGCCDVTVLTVLLRNGHTNTLIPTAHTAKVITKHSTSRRLVI